MPELLAPINEVVYSIGFERKASLVPPRLGVALTDLIERYPNTDVQQPYDMQLELPLEKQPTALVASGIDWPHGGFAGRIYVNVQPAVDTGRHRPALNLTLAVRSAPLEPQTLQAAMEFFEIAHTAVTDAFHSITTEQARKAWGLL